uniref:Olfactory receptor n=1 Tax=Geotrypetes seraphini TaxID=260995 RepID=A0A6P8NVV8_GEOSA|nr:olfactory receptor 1019-like [Geotrypetes seraphini]
MMEMTLKNPMEEENISVVTEFIILGFPEFPEQQIPLFLLFLLIYLVILMGNLIIITVTCLDPHLHTPMYFFLGNLSFLDISYTSVTLPKLMDILLKKSQRVSLFVCFTQMHFFVSLAFTEFLILGVMSYDRYVAICHPLHYAVLMDKRLCMLMATGTWIIGFLVPLTYTILISRFFYCRSNKLNHFFCDLPALLKLSCSSTYTIKSIMYIMVVFVGFPCFITTLMSYIYIISAILKIRSTEGRCKAFSTCSSHLTVVILFYGTAVVSYMRPTSSKSDEQNKFIAVLYNVLIPIFNPMIHSLKNQEVKKALRKICTTKLCSDQKNISLLN